MLEQTKRNGPVYETEPGEKSVLNRPADTSKWKFGPYLPITLYIENENSVWMKDEAHGGWFHYEGPEDAMKLAGRQETYEPAGDGFFYRYGMAVNEEGKVTPYYVQDELFCENSPTPDIQKFVLPFSLRPLSYDRVFTYPEELKNLLKDLPAAYADRYKRPIKRVNGRTYPISLGKDGVPWADLPEARYPVVVDLSGVPFAVLDLEPEHTKDELAVFNSIMGYYEEKTPREGRHKLVSLDNPAFKFRYGTGLELINNGMATFYGIMGVWFVSHPKPMPTEGFIPSGAGKAVLPPVSPPVEEERLLHKLDLLDPWWRDPLSTIQERNKWDRDNSRREFHTFKDIYREILLPLRNEFPEELFPWLMAACGRDIIEPREKHKTMRQGLPYLVYQAARAYEMWKDGGGGAVWRP